MKTAISIPDDLFDEADALARRMKTSRSELYSRAVRAYVAEHGAETVTESLDRVVADLGTQETAYVDAAARGVLERVEW